MSNTDSQVTTLDDAPSAASASVKNPKTAAKTVTAKAADGDSVAVGPMFSVTVHATGDDTGNDIVEVQPNGRLYRLPRGVPCIVPLAVLHILENAIVTKYLQVGADVVERSIPRFPFTATPA